MDLSKLKEELEHRLTVSKEIKHKTGLSLETIRMEQFTRGLQYAIREMEKSQEESWSLN